ncbi:MAG: protein-tyrosine phosphatase family protein [Anaerolineae bacterium]
MRYVYWVIEDLLAGRPGPHMYPWDPGELYAGGIRTIISMAAEEEVEDLTPYGFAHYHAEFPPVNLFSTGMQKAFIYQALPVWRLIDRELEAGNPTLVHCHAGQDRTGAILAGYLVTYRGLEPDQAIERLRAVKPAAMTAEGYEDAVRLLEPGKLPDPKTLL